MIKVSNCKCNSANKFILCLLHDFNRMYISNEHILEIIKENIFCQLNSNTNT